MTTEEGRDGPRPFLEWAEELAVIEGMILDPLEHRRPLPELEARLRELLDAGTVHHSSAPASSRLFDDAREAMRLRESDQVHAMRLAVEGMVARYAAEHPGEID